MLEQLKYVNHLGEVIEFGKKGIFANSNDLRDYEWTYDSSRSRAENFRKGVVSKAIPVVISAESKKKCIDLKNRLYEVCEKDIIAEQKGKLYIGDYYLECYVYSSAKSNYLDTGTTINISLKVVADRSKWIKKESFVFMHDDSFNVDGKGYEYGYDYDYSLLGIHVASLNVEDICDCDFTLKICGSAICPAVYIDGHLYNVNCMIDSDEQLIIDTKESTISLIDSDGKIQNMFMYRNKESNIFMPLSPGPHIVAWNSDIDLYFTIIHERGEPAWI